MAAVQYQLFCKCINSVTNKAISNTDKKVWISAYLKDCDDTKYDNEKAYIKETIIFDKDGTDETLKTKIQDKIVEGAQLNNPKYDMLFVYAGCDIKYAEGKGYPYLLADKYSRIFMAPWFIHSTHGSLLSVMEKAQELTKKIGHKNIKIGKVVPLDQYIDIV